jgi:molybdopterin biosynthesis enzyme
VDEVPPPGKIRDINRYTVSNLLKGSGARTSFIGIARDNIEEITERLELAREHDLILISGGSSKGERDFITDAIEKLGGEVRFMNGPELATYWETESEDNIKILKQLQQEGVKLGQ